MGTNIIIIGIFTIVTIFTIATCLIFFLAVLPLLKSFLEIKNKQVENDKMRLFMQMSPDLMEKELDKLLDDYVKRYIIYKFVANKIQFISSEAAETMVKDVTELVLINISDLYVFYLRMISDIKDDESLILQINSRVKNKCIDEVADFNRGIENVKL